jgi:hypothetical protein
MYGKQTRYTYIAVTDTQDEAAQFKVSTCSTHSWLVALHNYVKADLWPCYGSMGTSVALRRWLP